MINTNFRLYDFFTYGELNDHGQPQLSKEPKGKIKIFITTSSQSVQDNILYTGASYMGLTYDKAVNDNYVIDYNGTKLKVLYVDASRHLREVFLAKVG